MKNPTRHENTIMTKGLEPGIDSADSILIGKALELIKYNMTKCRKYASHFTWFDQRVEEKGVVRLLLESMEQAGDEVLHSLRTVRDDPPDCVAKDATGRDVAIEVTEIVDEDAIRYNQKGTRVIRDWKWEGVLEAIQDKIKDKDIKIFKGGPYSRIWLVIYTAEPDIISADFNPILQEHSFPPTDRIDEAFLLFSYNPSTRSYPYIRLKISGKR